MTANHANVEIDRTSSGKVSLATVAASVTQAAPAKLTSRQTQAICRYALQFFSEQKAHLVTELARWHAAHIDPSELSASTVSFEIMGNVMKFPLLKDAHLARLYIAQAMYTRENA